MSGGKNVKTASSVSQSSDIVQIHMENWTVKYEVGKGSVSIATQRSLAKIMIFFLNLQLETT